MAVKRPIYITEKGYTQEINASADTIQINNLEITSGGGFKISNADSDGYSIIMSDDGYVSFASGAFSVNPDGSVVSASGALQVGSDGALTVGTGAETASIDADGYMTLSAIETTATDGYAILTEGGKFWVRASDGYVKIGGFAQLMGGMSLGDDLAVSGGLTVQQLADFNGGLQANAIKIDSDTAQRLYIVGDDGYMKDESKLVFDGSKLSVTGDGYLSGALEVTGAADLNSSLDVAGQVDLAASGVATSVRGNLNVAEAALFASSMGVTGAVDLKSTLDVAGVADFAAAVKAQKIAIDGDVAQRLYLVGNDGYMQDEADLTYNGSKLSVLGDGYFSGALELIGAVDFKSTLDVAGVADFASAVKAQKIAIDGDVAQRLYIVDADGYMKDESKLTFDGYELVVDGDMSFTSSKEISFDGNTGLISGLADLTGLSDGYAAVNKRYVDAAIDAIGLDASNTSSSSLLAAESISIGDPIFINSNGKAARGDTVSSPNNEKAWVFGVAAAAAAADASVEVVRDGIASGVLSGLGMAAGEQVWLASGGGLTNVKPSEGRLILMGFALSAADLLVDVRDYGLVIA